MCSKYALEWLDALITVSLNGEKTVLTTLSGEQAHTIISKIGEEKEKVQAFLKNRVFSLTNEGQISLFLRQYHAALITLLNQALKAQQPDSAVLRPVYDALISSLDELLSFIEVRFSAYMSLDERVSATYLSVTKRELKNRVDALKTVFGQRQADRQLADIVFHKLSSFTDNTGEDQPVTFRELLYVKELVKELNVLEESPKSVSVYSPLDELLIYLNFNSQAYQKYFIQAITLKINDGESYTDKLDKLLFYFKEFKQMQRKAGLY